MEPIRPNIVVNGEVRPMDNDEYAQWLLDQKIAIPSEEN